MLTISNIELEISNIMFEIINSIHGDFYMFGKPEWFERRKYGGWGLHPKTWQGWLYIAVMVLPYIIFQSLPYWDETTRTYVTVAWVLFLLLDVGHIMLNLDKDEREFKIEAISERNAAWAMVLILVAGIMYQSIISALNQSFYVDWFLVAALFGGMIVKAISNYYLEKSEI